MLFRLLSTRRVLTYLLPRFLSSLLMEDLSLPAIEEE